MLHSHGAMRCLEALLALLAEGGVILMNDYGQAKAETAEDFEHQRFSLATFVGVNFALLGKYFGEKDHACWREPAGDEDNSIHSRLLMRSVQPQSAVRFVECYGGQARAWLETPAQKARELAKAGRLRAALGQYREALSRQPFSWPLLSEVSQFLTFGMGDARGGLELAREALRHNPACSADLWNVLGDCLFELGRVTEARLAFEKALKISPDDVRARFNLAFVHQREGHFERALVRLAEALARDRSGAYRERVLQKQSEVLGLIQQGNQRRMLGQVDRVAGLGPVPAAVAPKEMGGMQ